MLSDIMKKMMYVNLCDCGCYMNQKTLDERRNLYQSLAAVSGSEYPNDPAEWIFEIADKDGVLTDYENGIKSPKKLLSRNIKEQFRRNA